MPRDITGREIKTGDLFFYRTADRYSGGEFRIVKKINSNSIATVKQYKWGVAGQWTTANVVNTSSGLIVNDLLNSKWPDRGIFINKIEELNLTTNHDNRFQEIGPNIQRTEEEKSLLLEDSLLVELEDSEVENLEDI